jgi:cell division protein FtsB
MVTRPIVVWSAVFLALGLAFVSAAGEGGFRRYARLQSDVVSLKDKNQALSLENARLRKLAQLLKSDARAIESSAREELGLVRPGELVFTLEEP